LALVGNFGVFRQTAHGEEVRKYDVWVFDAGRQHCAVVNDKS